MVSRLYNFNVVKTNIIFRVMFHLYNEKNNTLSRLVYFEQNQLNIMYIHSMSKAKFLPSLPIFAGSLEPSLLNNAIIFSVI